MMKLIFAQADLIKGEIGISVLFAALLSLSGPVVLSGSWFITAPLLEILLCRGFHVLLGQSISGEGNILMQTLPVTPLQMMVSRGILCGLWTAAVLTEIVILVTAFSRYEPWYDLIMVKRMTLGLLARGLSPAEAALAMGLLPVLFFAQGWFISGGILKAHLRWGAAFEKRRCGILLTALSLLILSAAIWVILRVGDRLAGICLWSFGCYLAAMAVIGSIGWLFLRSAARLLETGYDLEDFLEKF